MQTTKNPIKSKLTVLSKASAGICLAMFALMALPCITVVYFNIDIGIPKHLSMYEFLLSKQTVESLCGHTPWFWQIQIQYTVMFILPFILILLFTFVLRGKTKSLVNLMLAWFGTVSCFIYLLSWDTRRYDFQGFYGFYLILLMYAALIAVWWIDYCKGKTKNHPHPSK